MSLATENGPRELAAIAGFKCRCQSTHFRLQSAFQCQQEHYFERGLLMRSTEDGNWWTFLSVICAHCGRELTYTLARDIATGEAEYVPGDCIRHIKTGRMVYPPHSKRYCDGPPTCVHCTQLIKRGEMPPPGTSYHQFNKAKEDV